MNRLKYCTLFLFLFLTFALPLFSFADIGGNPPTLPSPLVTNIDSIAEFVKAILTNIVLPIGAVVVVFFIIYSGYLFVTAGGNEKKIETAKHTFLYVLIGAAILLGSWAIALAVQNTLCQIAPSICDDFVGPPLPL